MHHGSRSHAWFAHQSVLQAFGRQDRPVVAIGRLISSLVSPPTNCLAEARTLVVRRSSFLKLSAGNPAPFGSACSRSRSLSRVSSWGWTAEAESASYQYLLSLPLLPMASEEDVGILCYTNFVPGFQGILKQRYADFIVNEVDLNGDVVHLTNLDAPADEITRAQKSTAQSVSALEKEDGSQEDGLNVVQYNAVLLEEFRALAGPSNAELLEKTLAAISSGEVDELSPIVLEADSDKAHRTAVHNFFKTRVPSLVTDTVDGPDQTSKCIRVRYCVGKQQRRGMRDNGSGRKRGNDWKNRSGDRKRQKEDQPFDKRGSDSWPIDREKHLQFYLYKENKDTQDALSVIGRMLGVQSKSFGFAGTKDKRAVTTQRATVFKQSAKKLAALNDRLFGIKVGNFSYVKEGLVLGQLSGNRFSITLRGVVADTDDAVIQAAEGLNKSGFINYFGLQRFGSGSVTTHSVGAALFRGEWKAAVELILSPREGEIPAIAEARNYYKKTKNIEGTLVRMPRYLLAERAILVSLKKSPGNYLQAITAIPRPIRLLYVHSYQSFLWNHAASFRASKYGVENVVEGDVVWAEEVDVHTASDSLKEDADEVTVDEEMGAMDSDVILGDADFAGDTPGQHRQAKLVTAEDVSSGKYSILDVLLPLPGSMVLYPGNETADVYQELATKDSLDLKCSKHNVKEFSITSVSGGYRHLVQKPIDLEWKLVKYSDPTVALAETDLDRIVKGGAAARPRHDQRVVEIETSSGDEKRALHLSFTLPSSCYATMVIRELLKTSTSVAFHKRLNPSHQDDEAAVPGESAVP